MSLSSLNFPNTDFREILTELLEYYKACPRVYAVILLGSLARGKAVEGSCIDLCIFLERRQMERLASTVKRRTKDYARLGGEICYYEGKIEGGIQFGDMRVDVSFTDGNFQPSTQHSFDITKDEFETTIGNLFVYAVPLYEKDDRYRHLKRLYLPFYDDALRRARLDGTAKEFRYKVWKTRWLARRGEFYAALDALLEAKRIFLQHLFIKERKYPIDFDKWLKEQCVQILNKPALYEEILTLINKIELTENGIKEKTDLIEKLFTKYAS